MTGRASGLPDRWLTVFSDSNRCNHRSVENDMSKGMDSKKGDKKKPAKTMKEKKTAKQEKKKNLFA